MTFAASITKRRRKRRLKSGILVVQTRYVVNYVEPSTNRRTQLFFIRHADAVRKRNELIRRIANAARPQTHPGLTVANAVEYWLEGRQIELKPATWRGYKQLGRYVVGPLLVGTSAVRRRQTMKGVIPYEATQLEMLGPQLIADLTTAQIRSWHKSVAAHVSTYTANVARKCFRAALSLAAEDFNLRIPPMPSRLGRGRHKPKKAILTLSQIALLIENASKDLRTGIYYAFPFLTGVRPSEQLALLWEDIDLSTGTIHIHSMQEQDGSITAYTKTTAGTREIPICPMLLEMLQRWKSRCPTIAGQPSRVFPRLGSKLANGGRWKEGGGTLSYANFRLSYWRPVFHSLSLPNVTPHSARHSFISTLQLQGIEIGLIAKLAGHASAAVTLSHYTHAVRGGEDAVRALQQAFTRQNATSTKKKPRSRPSLRAALKSFK